MKLFYPLFVIMGAFLATELNGMEEQPQKLSKKTVPKMRSLREIAANALRLGQREEIASIPEYLTRPYDASNEQIGECISKATNTQNSEEREKILSTISIQKQLQSINIILSNLVTKITADEYSQPKIQFIEWYISRATGQLLVKLRAMFFSHIVSIIKLPAAMGWDIEAREARRSRLNWFVECIQRITKTLTEIALEISSREPLPQFEQQFEEKVSQLIAEQDTANWQFFSSKLLLKNGIDQDLFFKYLFGIHIPSLKSNIDENNFFDQFNETINYIDKILIACNELLPSSNILHYLFKTYPETTDLLYSLNQNISLKQNTMPNHCIRSTILCPKLLLMFKLKNLFMRLLGSNLVKYLCNEEVEKCAQETIQCFSTFLDTRFMNLLFKDVITIIFSMETNVNFKCELSKKFVESLKICLPNVKFYPEMMKELDRHYQLKLKRFAASSPNLFIFQDLIPELEAVNSFRVNQRPD